MLCGMGLDDDEQIDLADEEFTKLPVLKRNFKSDSTNCQSEVEYREELGQSDALQVTYQNEDVSSTFLDLPLPLFTDDNLKNKNTTLEENPKKQSTIFKNQD